MPAPERSGLALAADLQDLSSLFAFGPQPDLPLSRGSNFDLSVLEMALHGLLADLSFAYIIWLHETRFCAAYGRRVGNAG
jgi:hypothetical protein